jgi:hypothetical protein
MPDVKATRWQSHAPFIDPMPGFFTFDNRHGEQVDQPRFMRFACPQCAQQGLAPIAPVRFSTGESYEWNGDRDAPTLKGRLNCQKQFKGCGWVGQLTNGVFSDAAN